MWKQYSVPLCHPRRKAPPLRRYGAQRKMVEVLSACWGDSSLACPCGLWRKQKGRFLSEDPLLGIFIRWSSCLLSFHFPLEITTYSFGLHAVPNQKKEQGVVRDWILPVGSCSSVVLTSARSEVVCIFTASTCDSPPKRRGLGSGQHGSSFSRYIRTKTAIGTGSWM